MVFSRSLKNSTFIVLIVLFLTPSPAFLQQTAVTETVPAFGYDIFRPATEAVTEGPIDENFVLSPGDKVIIKVWGQLTLNYALDVSEEGYLELKDENARIYTNGVSYRELRRLVNEKLAESYASYINIKNPAQSTAFVDVRLGQVRKVLAYVLGEVRNQGQYTVGAGAATLLNILNQAGGIKEKGSLREIRIRRTDGTESVVDLYEFLVTGKIDSKKTQVRQGDYILIPLKAKSVVLKGEVKRPAVYEAVKNEGIKQVLGFAGGPTANAYLNRVQVRRYEANRGERFIDLDLESIMKDPQKDFALVDGDEITVYPNILIRKRMVEIRGEGITRPGTYEFAAGMTLRNLIDKADGLKEYIFLDRADVVRTEADFSKRLTSFPLKDLFREDRPGHYVYSGKEEADFKLQEMDQITLYSKFQMKGGDKTITLEGHVKEPGTYTLAANMTLYDLIFSRGGFTDEAFKKKAYLNLGHIFRKTSGELDTKILSFNLEKLLSNDPKESILLESDDLVRIYSFETMIAQKPFVTIEGLVKRPGNYDMAEGMTLEDLVLLAGGLTPDAYRVEAVVGRTARRMGDEETENAAAGAQRAKTMISPLPLDFAALPKEKRTPLEVFDKVVIRHLAGWEPQFTVSIGGEIPYPGSYSLETREERISTLIKRAGGLKKEALAAGAALQRRKDITGMTAERKAEMDSVAIDLEKALRQPGGEADLVLKDGDRIFIPTNPGVVEIRGAVRQPGFVQFREGAGLKEYIANAGGYLPEAEKQDVTVYLPNRTAQKRNPGFIFGRNPEVNPGSIIEVPFKESKKGKENDVIPVNGAVKFPMSVKYRAGQRLDYYLRICGGLKDDADPGKIIIQFADGTTLDSGETAPFNPAVPAGSAIEIPFKEIPTEQKNKDFVILRGAVKFPLSVRYQEGRRMDYYLEICGGYAADADPGEIMVRLPDGTTLKNNNTAPFNPVIQAGSVIEIPAKDFQEKDFVAVKGAVKFPLSVKFKEGQKMEYYIQICGGYAAEANSSKVSILLPDGTTLQNVDNTPFNPVVTAGSTITVPDKTGKVPDKEKDGGVKK
jgi:polysaccharide export outer membrane protein